MLQGVVLGMLPRVVGLGKMVTMHKKFQKRKTTMELTRMQKMELTMEMVSKTNSMCIYSPTTLRRVQIMAKTSTNIT